MHHVTLALTHFNRYQMLLESFSQVYGDLRIGEILICDDQSTDGSYEKLLARKDLLLRIERNPRNLDCYRNKAEVLSHVKGPWAILFDSDNVLDASYLDKLFQLPEWDPDIIYCPCFAEPHFDYRAFSGVTITRQNVSALMGEKHFSCLLNTANYFVNPENYLKVWDGGTQPNTADSIYQAYNWLRSGRKLYVVPGLQYHHRIHSQSHYKLNVHKTGNFAYYVENLLRNLS